MDNKKILSICIPTYNRKDVLLPDVKKYLSLNDNRFRIVIQDNNSSDGTFEEITTISDHRLCYNRNQENIGSIPNDIKVLSNQPSEYVILILDKDYLNIKELPRFLDILESERPDFGYIDLSNNKPFKIHRFPKGKDALLNCSYLSKHPSGFFFKSSLWNNEVNQPYFKAIDPKFDFIFDVVCAHLACKYNGTIIDLPLIINASIREDVIETKTYTYNINNLYFSLNKRVDEFQIYFADMVSLSISQKLKKYLSKVLLNREIFSVTIVLRKIMSNKRSCDHHNLSERNVEFTEMHRNTCTLIKIFRKLAIPHIGTLATYLIAVKMYIKSLTRIIISIVVQK